MIWQHSYCSYQIYQTKRQETICSFTIIVTQHFNIIFQETTKDFDVNFCKKTCIFRQLLDTIFNPNEQKLDKVTTTECNNIYEIRTI